MLNSGIPHVLHLCQNPDCKCHSAERYEEEARKRRLLKRDLDKLGRKHAVS